MRVSLDMASETSLKDEYASIRENSCACFASSTSLFEYIDSL